MPAANRESLGERTRAEARGSPGDGGASPAVVSWGIVVLGPAMGLAPAVVPAPGGLSPEAWWLACVGAWVVLWWVTEVIPLAATSLLPLVLLPIVGVAPLGRVSAAYADPLIFLFLGGFLIAGAVTRWGLHRRIALVLVAAIGTRPTTVVGGVMLATAALSMWISNTATAVMMYAVGVSLVATVGGELRSDEERRRFGIALMLGIAYSASIGGLGTLIGTPPNALLAAYLAETGEVTLDFRSWMAIGMPLVLVLLPLTWWWLVRVAFPLPAAATPAARRLIRAELQALGPMTPAERRTLCVFGSTAALWILRPSIVAATGIPVSDTAVALGGALLLYVLPSGMGDRSRLLGAGAIRDVPWEVLLLFGGGLALALGIESTGLASTLGRGLGAAASLPLWAFVALLAGTVMALGELASNTASAAVLLPVAGTVAVGMGLDPIALAVPVALAASANFMLPVATPPNAVVFGWPGMGIRDMVRAGAVVDLLALVAVTILALSRIG